MRILIFAPEAFPPVSAESIVTTKFIYALIKQGIEVRVIHNPSGLLLYPVDTDPALNGISNVLINPYPRFIEKIKIPSKLKSLIWSLSAFIKGLSIIRTQRPDFIISRVMPVYGHFPALLISLFYKIPWVANWSDPTPLSISPKPYQRKSPLFDIAKYYCKMVVKRTGLNSFPNAFLADYYLKFYPQVKNKSIIVPHIAHSLYYCSEETNNPELNLIHPGSLGLRSPENLLAAFSKYLNNKRDAKIKLAFIGTDEPEVHRLITKFGLTQNVVVIPPVSYSRSLQLMKKADVSILIEADTETGIFLPSKVLDMIQLGKPIFSISPIEGVMAELLKSDNGGFAVDLNNENEIYGTLDKIYKAWVTKSLFAEYNSLIHQKTFNETVVISSFINELNPLKKENTSTDNS
jgi:glycosyltransferase involved in cell wall biosynthesis